MAAKKSQAIDILDAALATKGGESQLIVLDGCELSIRKNFTGAEARDYIEIWRIDKPTEDVEIIRRTIDLLSDSDDEAKKTFSDRLMEEASQTVARVLRQIAIIAGLRDGDGNFFPGSRV